MSISPLDLAYAAGFFDGEGYVKRRGYGRVVVVSTDKRIIDWFHENFGGGVYKRKRSGNRRPTWDWIKTGISAESFYRQIQPYLKLKAAQK